MDVKKREIRQVRLDPIEGNEGRWAGIREVVVAKWTLEEFATA